LSDVPSDIDSGLSDTESDGGSDFGSSASSGEQEQPRIFYFSSDYDGYDDITTDSLVGMHTRNDFVKNDPVRNLEPFEGARGLTYVPINLGIVSEAVIRYQNRGRVRKPSCILEYNKNMRGVDKADQYLIYHSILQKTVIWSKEVVLWLVNCGLFNAFNVYKIQNPGSRMKYKNFFLETAS
jgi:hypothetical protein